MDKPILKDSMKLFEPLGKIKSRSMFGGFGLLLMTLCLLWLLMTSCIYGQTNAQRSNSKPTRVSTVRLQKTWFPVVTKYFALPEGLWQDQEKILELATTSLGFAKEEKAEQSSAKPTRLKDLPNLRLATERMLKKAGIDSVERLYESGSVNAFNAIKESHASSVSIELLWALEGAINGTHWSVIPQQRREELINRVN